MPELIPFKSYYYREGIDESKLRELVAPPYDVISKDELTKLKRNPDNICHVILPETYDAAGLKLDQMIDDGIFTCSDKKCFYIYGIDYKRPDNGEVISRYGFIGLLKLVEIFPSNDGVIPHEMTFRKYTEDRFQLIKRTDSNFSPLFMIYNGDGMSGTIFNKYISMPPFLKTLDRDGFTHKIWEIRDEDDIKTIQQIVKSHQTIIADGHHRYITSLRHSRHKGSKHIMTMFIDFNDPGMIIYTTHREVQEIPVKDVEEFKEKVSRNFQVEEVNDFSALQETLKKNEGKHVFGCYFKKKCIFLKLKESIRPEDMIEGIHSNSWKTLNIPILHDILLKGSLDVKPEDIDYIKDVKKGLERVDEGAISALFILNPTTLAEIQTITRLKEIMPQKSTYFYPKPLSALIFHRHSSEIE